jgi:hypothetical protein|tara:strand:+ start:3505 stop:3684 length:180 start_codon:yes stop_codon:yes gene_type:complete
MKKQKLTQDEKNEKNFNQLSNVLGRIIQISYDDKTQLRRLKAWHGLIGQAIEDIQKGVK